MKVHFRGRKMGVVEAVYDIMSWHKQQPSDDVVFIDTNMPSQQRRILKRKEHISEMNPTTIK